MVATTGAPAAFDIDGHGWLVGTRRCLSPNRDARPPQAAIELLVIHNISLPPGQLGGAAIEDLFLNRLDPRASPFFATLVGMRVSSHFLIERSGRITQFVSCLERAWHAGASEFDGRRACNDFSVGIELEGTDFEPFDDVQYIALARLTRALRLRYPVRAVRGHQHIAVERKTDPGPYFDWLRLARDAQLPLVLLPPSVA
jgi:AmpD protein